MISLAEKARDLLGIMAQAAFIVDDLGAMGHMVSSLLMQVIWNTAKAGNTPTRPKPSTKPVALSLGPSQSKTFPPPKPSPKSGPSTPTTINPNLRATPVAINPDPNENQENSLKLIIPIACELSNLNDDPVDEELAVQAAPVDDDEPELLPITNIDTTSTPDIPPIQPVNLDFEIVDINNIKQIDADFDNMAVMEHEETTGNDIESQALKNKMMNNVYEDWLTDLINNENFQKANLHRYHMIAVNRMVKKEYSLERGGLLADDCGTGKTLTALALICYQVIKYEQLLKQLHPGLEKSQIKMDDMKVQEEKGQTVEKTPPKPCWEVHLPTFILW
ncbi:hypothetical protein BDD12DRAFT_885409 [Trichophaea hybrida]|nr:hypothetical protein BDD12DRAFT_885409 [Trichophaea hybrida]